MKKVSKVRSSENEWKVAAFRYYCLGLNSKEIGKLLDLSYRTVQGVMSSEKWKEQRQEIRTKEAKRIVKRYKRQNRIETVEK